MVVKIFDNVYDVGLNEMQTGDTFAVQFKENWKIYKLVEEIDDPYYNVWNAIKYGKAIYLQEIDPLKYNVVTDRNPTTEDSYEVPGVKWFNYKTGEQFILQSKLINNKPLWIGDKGTFICADTTRIMDIFEDGSAIALWEFNDNFNDTGGVYNLKEIGKIPFKEGLAGKCAYFDGRRSYLVQEKLEKFPSNNASVSFWFKPLRQNGNYGCMFHLSHNGQNTFSIWVYKDLRLYTILNDRAFPIIEKLEINKWYHVVLTTEGKIYLNGELKQDNKITIDLSTVNRPLLIGADRDGMTYTSINDFYKGCIEEMRLFNKVLTDQEILALYNEMNNLIKDVK